MVDNTLNEVAVRPGICVVVRVLIAEDVKLMTWVVVRTLRSELVKLTDCVVVRLMT